jgi:DNA-binding transcriptional ArsR family regulator
LSAVQLGRIERRPGGRAKEDRGEVTVADDVIVRDLEPVGGMSSNDRAQLSSLYSIFGLSSLMFDGRGPEAIFDLFEGAAPSLAACRVETVYRLVDGSLVDGHAAERSLDGDIDSVVLAAVGADREIDMPDGQWRYAITLRAVRAIVGVVVVHAASAPPARGLFLLKALARQAAAAITAAELVESERDRGLQLYELTVEHEQTIERLSHTVDELNRRQQIHEQLTDVSGSGRGEAGVAEALNRLTSLAVIVEDVFGNVRAAAGEPRPDDYRPIGGVNRDDVLRHAATIGSAEREGDRLFRVVRRVPTCSGFWCCTTRRTGPAPLTSSRWSTPPLFWPSSCPTSVRLQRPNCGYVWTLSRTYLQAPMTVARWQGERLSASTSNAPTRCRFCSGTRGSVSTGWPTR